MMVVDALLKHALLPLGGWGVGGCGNLLGYLQCLLLLPFLGIKKKKNNNFAFYPAGISGAL